MAFKLLRQVRSMIKANKWDFSELHPLFSSLNQHITHKIPLYNQDEMLFALHNAENFFSHQKRKVARKINTDICHAKVEKLIDNIDKNRHNVFKLLRKNMHNNIGCIFFNNDVVIDPPKIESILNKE